MFTNISGLENAITEDDLKIADQSIIKHGLTTISHYLVGQTEVKASSFQNFDMNARMLPTNEVLIPTDFAIDIDKQQPEKDEVV